MESAVVLAYVHLLTFYTPCDFHEINLPTSDSEYHSLSCCILLRSEEVLVGAGEFACSLVKTGYASPTVTSRARPTPMR